MTIYQFETGTIEVITDKTAIYVGEEHSSSNLSAYKKVLDFMKDIFPNGFKLIINKINSYDVDFSVIQALAVEPSIDAIAIVLGTKHSHLTADLEEIIIQKHKPIRSFSSVEGVVAAQIWLESHDVQKDSPEST